MSKNKWVRSISFNHTNPDDIRRLDFIGKKSFSGVIKKLIDEEIKRKSSITINSKSVVSNSSIGTPQQKQQVVPQPYNPMLRGN
ncbi:hypothetical protein P9E76_15545 [Schinkia azotoformans]|uniref:Uncharacterized protein n=1 Tax=Schinkia azotoformans LMG 9581 TaxID=1131731 RepID=K6DJ16_SCHAZ|nr:hypothetical protein [Schinkia azotoformans]EKN68088.1 hypothetical protein BAZO_06209 [Schinkia azotoformans LMG 9581]MEC1638108.1 hypothetical protein [Schinkia azotoformans]MEC1946458.1 hypothetical protein [Schinkia azotoformans]